MSSIWVLGSLWTVLFSAALERARHRQLELLDVERLGDVVVRAALDRLHRAGDVAERGDEDHRCPGRLLGEGLEHVEPARALHAHVGDHQVVALGGRALDGAGAVVDRLDREALAAQDLAQQIARHAIVLGDQHAGHARPPAAPATTRARGSAPDGAPSRGRRTKKVDPWPGWLSTEMVPPSAAVSCRQIARPRPVPLPRPLVV
jgi:hypothetical protein